ncbi:MAG TPA: TrkA family potassium uptake protein [Candidatus Limnocylindrales bacterium]
MKTSVLVIGLGRFGASCARELMALGHQVLAVDIDETIANEIAPEVTHAVQLDAADEIALSAIGAADFEHAIVAISAHVEASIFATMALKKLGVPNVTAKAGSTLHGAILERVGADRVVFAEREMGERIAHSFAVRNVVDYLDVAPQFGIVKVVPPDGWVGQSLRRLDLAGRLALTPIALRRGDGVTVNPDPEETVHRGDELILIGKDDRLEELDRSVQPA